VWLEDCVDKCTGEVLYEVDCTKEYVEYVKLVEFDVL